MGSSDTHHPLPSTYCQLQLHPLRAVRAFTDRAEDRVDAGGELGVEPGRVSWLQGVGERLPDALPLEHEAVRGGAVVDDVEANRSRRQLGRHLDRKIGQADVNEL